MNNKTGLHVGDMEGGGLITAVRFMCSNETTTEEVAMETQFDIGFKNNFTFDDFSLKALFSNTKIIDNKVMFEKFPFNPDSSTDGALTALWTAIANDYNGAYPNGWDFKKNQIIGFVAGMVKHTLLTPYMQDNYYYGGFSRITDGVW